MGGTPLHDAVVVHCKRSTISEIKENVPSIGVNGEMLDYCACNSSARAHLLQTCCTSWHPISTCPSTAHMLHKPAISIIIGRQLLNTPQEKFLRRRTQRTLSPDTQIQLVSPVTVPTWKRRELDACCNYL